LLRSDFKPVYYAAYNQVEKQTQIRSPHHNTMPLSYKRVYANQAIKR